MGIKNWIGAKSFRVVHGNNLVYNTCWEDPRLDREALELTPKDVVMVITSAGCNALDYALDGPEQIHCVDVNPRQNALLELKLAGIRTLDFETFFEMFGCGRLPGYRETYASLLRPELSSSAQRYWDRRIGFFSGRGWRKSFYFHGTSGIFAHLVNIYIDRVAKVRDEIDAILAARSVEEQQAIYHARLRRVFWKGFLRWLIARDTTLSLVGVPGPQRRQVEKDYAGGIAGFVEDSLDAVFSQLPLHDNYFWRVYLTGKYTPDCCPEYLRPENFQLLKDGLVDRIRVHTATIRDFLAEHDGAVSRFILLDHMDWMSSACHPELQREWQAIVDRAAPQSRILFRSGGLDVDYVDPLPVRIQGRRREVGELLTYHRTLAEELHPKDRVHTYGSFHIADLALA
jgi:S-adenosylmethionine-diacylglycerol 3-amino-3-carboxypropyl transferase